MLTAYRKPSLKRAVLNKTYPTLNAKCEPEVNEIIKKAGEISRPLRCIYVFKKELAYVFINNSSTSEENTLNLLPDTVFGWE